MSASLPVHSNSSIFLDQDLLTNFSNGNNTFVYNFAPRTVWTTPETKMSLSNFSVPFSWYNITAALQNNLIGYTWYDGGTSPGIYPITSGGNNGTAYFVTIPDGYYDIPTLNAFLQFSMVQNGLYLTDANSNNVYFLEIVLNPTTYRVQLNSYQLPLSLPASWHILAFSRFLFEAGFFLHIPHTFE